MSDRCRRVYDKEIGWFDLPGCMGAAVYGKSGCTCPKASKADEMEMRLQSIERAITKISERLA